MAIVKLNSSFDYNGDKKDYYVQMKRRRFPWWIFLLLLIPLFIWLYKEYEERKTEEVVEEPDPPVVEEDELPDPVPGCGVHFSTCHLSDGTDGGFGTIFQLDCPGQYVGAGDFPSCYDAFSLGSFHGVAVDKGTRLIVYKEPDFKGDVLCDITGPILINCTACTDHTDEAMTKKYIPELQVLFPPENRKLDDDFYGGLALKDWYHGSCKIICEPCQEESNNHNDK